MAYSTQQMRGLSPITELTTPASMRSIFFPHEEGIDYASDHDGNEPASPQSPESTQTILASLPEPRRGGMVAFGIHPCSTDVNHPMHLAPPIPARSLGPAARHESSADSVNFSRIDLPHSQLSLTTADLPTSDLPHSKAVTTYSDRVSLRQTERHLPDLTSNENIECLQPELYVDAIGLMPSEGSDAGMAGVGAGGRSRRGSLKDWPSGSLTTGPRAARLRPNTFHGTAANRIDLVLGNGDEEVPLDVYLPPVLPPFILSSNHMHPAAAQTSSAHAVDRSKRSVNIYRLFQSEPSLPMATRLATPHSPTSLKMKSKTPPKTPIRSSTVSNIFLGLFGGEVPSISPSEGAGRRLSKRRKSGSDLGAGGVTTTSDSTPPAANPDNTVIDTPQTAIKTQGTFGIRDDGSELLVEDQELPAMPSGRTLLDNGSTRSRTAERSLHVENTDQKALKSHLVTPWAGDVSSSPLINGNFLTPSNSGDRQDKTIFQSRVTVHTPPLSSRFAISPQGAATGLLVNPTPILASTMGYVISPYTQSTMQIEGLRIPDRQAQSAIRVDNTDSRALMIDKSIQTSELSPPLRLLTRPPEPPDSGRASLVSFNDNPSLPERLQPPHLHIPPPPSWTDSLTGNWLDEVDRIGRAGWMTLHRAEEAWMDKMQYVRDVFEKAEEFGRRSTVLNDGLSLGPRVGSSADPRMSSDEAQLSEATRSSMSQAVLSEGTAGYTNADLGFDEVKAKVDQGLSSATPVSKGGVGKLRKRSRPQVASVFVPAEDHSRRERRGRKNSWIRCRASSGSDAV